MNVHLVFVRRILPLVVAAAAATPSAVPRGMAQEGDVIPLAPIDVTAQYPLTPPTVKSMSKPAYPEAARRREEQGTVTVVVKVLPDGNVGDINVKKSSGSSALDEAAQAEARSWKFVPARRGPKAVEAWVEVPVKFQLVE